MTGDVPASIAELPHLEHLYLANEHLRPVRQGYCGCPCRSRPGPPTSNVYGLAVLGIVAPPRRQAAAKPAARQVLVAAGA